MKNYKIIQICTMSGFEGKNSLTNAFPELYGLTADGDIYSFDFEKSEWNFLSVSPTD